MSAVGCGFPVISFAGANGHRVFNVHLGLIC